MVILSQKFLRIGIFKVKIYLEKYWKSNLKLTYLAVPVISLSKEGKEHLWEAILIFDWTLQRLSNVI